MEPGPREIGRAGKNWTEVGVTYSACSLAPKKRATTAFPPWHALLNGRITSNQATQQPDGTLAVTSPIMPGERPAAQTPNVRRKAQPERRTLNCTRSPLPAGRILKRGANALGKRVGYHNSCAVSTTKTRLCRQPARRAVKYDRSRAGRLLSLSIRWPSLRITGEAHPATTSAWLFHRHRLQQTHDSVADGALLHETAYHPQPNLAATTRFS
jgi:hypothetical protein